MRRLSTGMLLTAACAACWSGAAARAASPVTLSGHCYYPEAVARFQQKVTLLRCDGVALRPDAASGTIAFTSGARTQSARFLGAFDGDRMAVSGLALRDGAVMAATGTCQVVRNGERIKSVACLAHVGKRDYGANFQPSAL